MTESCVERASARMGEICSSEFGRVAAAIDEAEAAAWNRIGGSTKSEELTLKTLERRLARLRPPLSLPDWQWLPGGSRALDNEWHRVAARPMLVMLEISP